MLDQLGDLIQRVISAAIINYVGAASARHLPETEDLLPEQAPTAQLRRTVLRSHRRPRPSHRTVRGETRRTHGHLQRRAQDRHRQVHRGEVDQRRRAAAAPPAAERGELEGVRTTHGGTGSDQVHLPLQLRPPQKEAQQLTTPDCPHIPYTPILSLYSTYQTHLGGLGQGSNQQISLKSLIKQTLSYGIAFLHANMCLQAVYSSLATSFSSQLSDLYLLFPLQAGTGCGSRQPLQHLEYLKALGRGSLIFFMRYMATTTAHTIQMKIACRKMAILAKSTVRIILRDISANIHVPISCTDYRLTILLPYIIYKQCALFNQGRIPRSLIVEKMEWAKNMPL